MNALQALSLAGHCAESPAACRPTPPSPWATTVGIGGTVLVVISIVLALAVCAGWGAEDDTKRMRWALGGSVGCAIVAFALLGVPGAIGSYLLFPLWTLPPLAFGVIRLIKESGNPVLARRLGMGLGIALGISGLLVVGAAIVFFLAMNSWANSK